MKKVTVLAALATFLLSACGGANTIQKEVERMVKKENADLVAAKKLLEPAFSDPAQKNLPETWYVAGLISEKSVDKDYLAMQLGNPVDEPKFYANLLEMVEYYVNAAKLDAQPNAEGKVKRRFDKKISEPLTTYYQLLVNGGASYLEKSEFEKASKYFQTYLDVKKMDIFQGTPVAASDSLSMQIGFFNAYALSQIPDNHKAAIKAFESIKNEDYRRSDVYQLLALEYFNDKDNEGFINTLKEGATLFPNDEFFLNNLIDSYIKASKNEEAKTYLDQALSITPNNNKLLYVYAVLYEQGYHQGDKAVETYKKVLANDPSNAAATFGIARCLFNEGHEIINNVDVTDAAKYKEASEVSDKLFKSALPYFEKAAELNPENKSYLSALSNCYYVLGMNDKREVIEKKIQSL